MCEHRVVRTCVMYYVIIHSTSTYNSMFYYVIIIIIINNNYYYLLLCSIMLFGNQNLTIHTKIVVYNAVVISTI